MRRRTDDLARRIVADTRHHALIRAAHASDDAPRPRGRSGTIGDASAAQGRPLLGPGRRREQHGARDAGEGSSGSGGSSPGVSSSGVSPAGEGRGRSTPGVSASGKERGARWPGLVSRYNESYEMGARGGHVADWRDRDGERGKGRGKSKGKRRGTETGLLRADGGWDSSYEEVNLGARREVGHGV